MTSHEWLVKVVVFLSFLFEIISCLSNYIYLTISTLLYSQHQWFDLKI